MPRTITLQRCNSGTVRGMGAIFGGDTVTLSLSLDTSYQSKTATIVAYFGSPRNKIETSNILPAFSTSGNNTVVMPALITNSTVTIDLEPAQTAYLETLTGVRGVNQPFALEIQFDLGLGVTDTYGIYEFFVEQDLATGATPAVPFDFNAPFTLTSSNAVAVDFASSNYFNLALAHNTTLSFLNPTFGRVISVRTVNTGVRTRPVLPANCDVYADTWDTSNGATNLITIQCRNQTTPAFDVTFNSKI